MARRIVYLDQAVLSNLARNPSSPVLKNLLALVEADKALFPFSWTHHYEAELDDRWEDAIRRRGATLSRGIRFRPYALIVAEQARRAYLNFVGEEQPTVDWRDAYEHDPRGRIGDRWLGQMLGARVATSNEGRDRRRAIKELSARGLSAERSARSTTAASFDEVRERRAVEGVEFYFVKPWQRSFAGALTDLDTPMLQFVGRVADAALGVRNPPRTVQEVTAGVESMWEFFVSKQCLELPFIDIESTILASLEIDEKDRSYAPSDFYDVETWSAYLPYVDMAVADKQMHQVLNRRRFVEKFGCSVYPNNADGLSSLIAELTKAG